MDRTLRSYILYYGLAIVCFILADIAEKKNNKKYVFWIVLLLSLIMGLRKQSVGIDTQNYYGIFATTKTLKDAFAREDSIFYAIAFFLMKIKNDPYFPIFVFSSITNYLVIYRLWDYKDISSYKYAILRYIGVFYFFSFNCMRQFLSVAIVFWGTKYLESGQYNRFIVFIILASSIHLSALASIGFIIVEYLRRDKLTKRQNNYVNISILLIPIIVYAVSLIASGRYEKYFTRITTNNLSSAILKLLIFTISFIFLYSEKVFKKSDYKPFMSIVYYMIGLAAIVVGIRYRYIERIGYYYYIYGTIYVGILANNKRYKYLIRLIILFIVIRAFVLNCQMNSMGQMPYLFNWE